MRLATRLSLSYIGFLALLSFLVLLLAGLQINRLAHRTADLEHPASAGDTADVARHLGENGLAATIPEEFLTETLKAGGWAQVLDANGREVQAVGAPSDRKRQYRAAELAVTALDTTGQDDWFYAALPITTGDALQGLVILAAPSRSVVNIRLAPPVMNIFWSYFLTGVGMAILAAVVLALLAGIWYARRLARPLERLSKELAVAAAGDFSHRIPAAGKDEFAVLAGAYNNLVERLAAADLERTRMEQARRDLVANISHDLRTPLNSIQGFTDAMADETTPSETRQRYAETVADRITALNGMLGDLLELSRLQALPEVKRLPTDLPELIREQVIALMPEIERAGIEVDVDLPDDLEPVPVDSGLIGRALQNLLVNAVRHTGGAHHLRVGLVRSGDGVAIRVADDGHGIAPADLPALFERYYQGTSASNRQRGTGLGLAIVRQIAENHGGRVEVETTEGQGTRFTLWLPIVRLM